MPTIYQKKCGRLNVSFRPDFGSMGAMEISCPKGWNDSVPIQTHSISIEEARDLRYLLDRAIAVAES